MAFGTIYPVLSMGPTSGETIGPTVMTPLGDIEWAAPIKITNNTVEDTHPALVVDRTTNAHAHIMYYQNGKDFKYQEFQALGKLVHGETTITSGSMAFQQAAFWTPNAQPSEYFGIDRDGNIHVLWAYNSDPWSTGQYQKFSNTGKPISQVIILCSDPCTEHSPSLSVGKNNYAYVGMESEWTGEKGILTRIDRNLNIQTVNVKEKTDGISLVVDTWNDDTVHYFSRTSFNSTIYHTKFTADLQKVVEPHSIFNGLVPGNGVDSPVPLATTTPNGHVHIIFYNRTANPKTLYYGELDKAGNMLNDGKLFNITKDACDYGDITGDRDYNVHVVWGSCSDGNIHYTKIVEGDELSSFSKDPVNVSAGLNGRSSWPQIGVGVGGGLHVVFLNDADGDNEVFYRFSYTYGVKLELMPTEEQKMMFTRFNETNNGYMTIKNTGNMNDTIILNITLDKNGHNGDGWAAWLDKDELTIKAQNIFPTQVHIKGPSVGRSNDNVTVTITATSTNDTTKNDTIYFKVFLVVERKIELYNPENVQMTGAGVPTEFQINIRNCGDLKEVVLLTLDGPVDWNFTLNTYEVLLEPKFWRAIHLTVTPPPDALADEIGMVMVEGYSAEAPEIKGNAITHTIVSPTMFLELTPNDAVHYVDPGGSTTFEIKVVNHGNMPGLVVIILKIVSTVGDWTGFLDRTSLGLTANAEGTVLFTMQPLFNATANSRLMVRIEGYNDARTQWDVAEVMAIVNPVHDVYFNLSPASISMAPGDQRTFDAYIANGGNDVELLNMGISNLPIGWTANFLYDDAQVTGMDLNPWSHKVMGLELQVPSDALVGSYAVKAYLDNGLGINLTKTIQVVIKHISMARVECSNPILNGVPNGNVSFQLVIKNLGNGPDTLDLSVEGELSNDWVTSFEAKDGSVDQVALGVNAVVKIKLNVSIPAHPLLLTVPIKAIATSSDGSSTHVDLELSVKLPDLTFVHVIPTQNAPEKGTAYCFDVMVMNPGEVSAGQFLMTFSIDGVLAHSKNLGPLGPGQSVNATFCWIPSSASNYQVKFVMDPENAITESNELNNQVELTVKMPNVRVYQIDLEPFLFLVAFTVITIFIMKRK